MLLKDLENQNKSINLIKNNIEHIPKGNPFDVALFLTELLEKNQYKNKKIYENSCNITAYDISSNCIKTTVGKLRRIPLESYADVWLQVLLKQEIGKVIHKFIQDNTSQFTEIEVSLKVPSLGFYGIVDGLISNNILCDIKSCSFLDYYNIVKNNRAREEDIYQCLVYKFILENYLQETKNLNLKLLSNPPKLSKYDIDTIQLIYVANDVLTDDINDISDIKNIVSNVKKFLKSKNNQLYFIYPILIDSKNISKDAIEWIDKKFKRIKHYIDTDSDPVQDDEFINKKKCYHCLYKDLCR